MFILHLIYSILSGLSPWIKLNKSCFSDVPEVEITKTSPASVVKQGQKMTLRCNVKRSKPQPQTYTWFKEGAAVAQEQKYAVDRVEPEDSGSYTCSATNTAGTGTSQPFQIMVECKFHSSLCCMKVRELMTTGERK